MSGRAATATVIPGRHALSVGNPGTAVPPGWAWISLGELAEMGTGHTPSRGVSAYWGGDIPWMGIRDARAHHGGTIWSTAQTITQSGLDNSSARLLPAGTVALSRTASVGYVVQFGCTMATSQDFVTWTCGAALDPYYLMRAIEAEGDGIRAFGEGSTHTTIYFTELKALEILTPPQPEQRRIVVKISQLSSRSLSARDNILKAMELSHRLREKILSAAYNGALTLNWRARHQRTFAVEKVTVSSIAEIITGSTPPTSDKDRYFGGDIPFIKPSDLDASYHVSRSRETLSREGARISRYVPAGSTLLTCIGATIGKSGFARVSCCTNQQINSIVPDTSKAMPEWLYWMTTSKEFKSQVIENSSATTLPIINKSRLQKLHLPLFLLDEQAEIVRRIEHAFAAIDRLTVETQAASERLKKLDQAILAKAFRGELVPQDPNDEPASALLERIRAERAAAGPAPKRGRRARGAAA